MLNLLSIGADISRVRSRLSQNVDFLEDARVQKELAKKLCGLLTKAPQEASSLPPFSRQLLQGAFLEMFQRHLTRKLKQIARRPFRINLLSILLVECMYALENKLFLAPDIDYLGKHFAQTLWTKTLPAFLTASPEEGDRLAWEFAVEAAPDNPQYSVLFAYTLRQLPLKEVASFLRSKQSRHQGDYRQFLTYLIRDYGNEKRIITPTHADEVMGWVNAEFSKKKEGVTGPILPLLESSVPEGWISVPGKLTEEQLGRFFSFFFLEKGKGDYNSSLLTQSETTELIRYGFAYPKKVEPEKQFELQFSKGGLPKQLVFYMFYQLFTHHKRSYNDNRYKDHFALFLKKHFVNFANSSLTSIRDSIRNLRPRSLRREFDLDKYLP